MTHLNLYLSSTTACKLYEGLHLQMVKSLQPSDDNSVGVGVFSADDNRTVVSLNK